VFFAQTLSVMISEYIMNSTVISSPLINAVRTLAKPTFATKQNYHLTKLLPNPHSLIENSFSDI
ncbi:MAG: hypothetical protein E7G91_04935, partial [Serratia liquefaciens]|nr:hypothetical protein [Serratia liquefaciens]